MKFKTPGFIIIMVIWAMGLSAENRVPPNYAIECKEMPDHSEPVSLKVWVENDRVMFRSYNSGGHLYFYRRLFELPQEIGNWGQSEVLFSFPIEDCYSSHGYSKIMTCFHPEDLSVELKLSLLTDNTGLAIDDTTIQAQVSRPEVRLRRVHQISILGRGYELAVGERDRLLWDNLLTLSYFHERCERQ